MPPRRAAMRAPRHRKDDSTDSTDSRSRSSSPDDFKYSKGDQVWCDFKGVYYKAKILEIKLNWDEQYYKIHYWKFSKKDDVTVRESKLLDFNKMNNAFVRKHNRNYKELCKKKKEEAKCIKSALANSKLPIEESPPFLKLEHVCLKTYQYLLNKNKTTIKKKKNSQKEIEALKKQDISNAECSHDNITIEEESLLRIDDTTPVPMSSLHVEIPGSEQKIDQAKLTNTDTVLDKDLDKGHNSAQIGLLKDFSSKEKVVINVLDNMLTKTKGRYNNYTQRDYEVDQSVMRTTIDDYLDTTELNGTEPLGQKINVQPYQADLIEESILSNDNSELSSTSSSVNLINNKRKTFDNKIEISKNDQTKKLKVHKQHNPKKESKHTELFLDNDPIILSRHQSDFTLYHNLPISKVTHSKTEDSDSSSSSIINQNLNDQADDQIKKLKVHKQHKPKKESKHTELFLDNDPIILSRHQSDFTLYHNLPISKVTHSKTEDSDSSSSTINNQNLNDQADDHIEKVNVDNQYNQMNSINEELSLEKYDIILGRHQPDFTSNHKSTTSETNHSETIDSESPSSMINIQKVNDQADDVSNRNFMETESYDSGVFNSLSTTMTNLIMNANDSRNDILNDNSSCDIFKLKDINLIENTTNKQELDENEILTTNGHDQYLEKLNVSSTVEESTENQHYYEDKNDFLLNDDEKVTTSYSEERPQLADCINSNDVSVGGVSSYEVHNTTSTAKESNLLETTIVISAPVEINSMKNNLYAKSFITNNVLNEDVTTSKSEKELRSYDQEDVISSNEYSVGDDSNFGVHNVSCIKENIPRGTTNTFISTVELHSENNLHKNLEQEVTTSKLEEHSESMDQQDIIDSTDHNLGNTSSCVIKRLINEVSKKCKCHNIKDFKIVAGMSDLEKNMDNHENSNIVHETDSSGSTSLVVTTSSLNSEKSLCDSQRNIINNEARTGHTSNVSIKLENLIEPLILDSEDCIIGDKSDCESIGTSKLIEDNPSRNVSLFVTTTAVISNKNMLHDIECNTNDEDDQKRQNLIVPVILENVDEEQQHSFVPNDRRVGSKQSDFIYENITSGITTSSTSPSPNIINNKRKINEFVDGTSNELDDNPYVEKAKASSSTTSIVSHINMKINTFEDDATDEDDQIMKKIFNSSTSSIVSNNEHITDVLEPISPHTSNEHVSYACASSSTSIPSSNLQIESDNDNDGQTTDDEDQYVKNRKVSKKKLKQYDADLNVFEIFGFEKPHSRAAKVKANEAISQMSKPPVSKEKKTEIGKRTKNGKKKDDDDPCVIPLKLSDYNLDVPIIITRQSIEDKHLMMDERFTPTTPPKLSVYSILHDYATKFNMTQDILDLILESFNQSLDTCVLHHSEMEKYDKYNLNYPNIPLSKHYGIIHLFRYIVKLPLILHTMKIDMFSKLLPQAVRFMEGLFIYLVDEDLHISINDYDCIMPEQYRVI